MGDTWKMQWGYEVAVPPVRPGIYRLRTGGYLLRAKLTDLRSAREIAKQKVLHAVPLAKAEETRERWLAEERGKLASPTNETPLFCDFAASLFEQKVTKEKIRSGKGRAKWEEILRLHLIPRFGTYALDDIHQQEVEEWFLTYGKAVQTGELSPHTANTRIRILRVIYGAAAAKYKIANPTDGVDLYDTTLHPTYSPEEPNSLTVEELPRFLDAMYEHRPRHFAVSFLGFVTGLRPSTLFPLRVNEDIRWSEREIWIRRSHTYKQEVMPTTKTGRGYPIGVPEQVLRILQWHVDHQIDDGRMRESGLIFPSERGTIRFTESLAKPFAVAAKAAGITKHITPRAMRRTYQDLTRAAKVDSIVKRSISGHATEAMEGWYSTVHPDEQREQLRRVMPLFSTALTLPFNGPR